MNIFLFIKNYPNLLFLYINLFTIYTTIDTPIIMGSRYPLTLLYMEPAKLCRGD